MASSSTSSSSSADKNKSTITNNKTNNVYESDDQLSMYLSLHFPISSLPTNTQQQKQDVIIPHNHSPTHALRFPQRVAQLLQSLKPRYTNGRALDAGCAVGGSSFELAKFFDHVEAFDNSENFIRYAKKMQNNEEIKYHLPIEGDLYEEVTAIHEDGVYENVRNKVHFFVGDACKLPLYSSLPSSSSSTLKNGKEEEAGILGDKFDGVILSNLLCRIPNPVSCLDGLAQLTNEGGVVVIVTPFSWFEHFTPKENWLGGYYNDTDNNSKEAVKSADILKNLMKERGFERIYLDQMPLVIREHQRKYQYIVSEATGWRKV